MIEPGWITAGAVIIINTATLAYGAGKFAQRCNGVDGKAGKAHNRIDAVEEKQNDMLVKIERIETNVEWLVKKNGKE